MRHGIRLKYLDTIGKFPNGNPRRYVRKRGERVAMPDLPLEHPDFIVAYAAAISGKTSKPTKQISGTIGAGVEAYLASTEYLSLAATTREQHRRIADKIKAARGRGTLVSLRSKHIRKDIAELGPTPALSRLKVWRKMCRLWVDKALIETDPARDVRKPKQVPTNGHLPFERKDFEAFRKQWPVGTQQRFAFELAYASCAAAVDLVALGPANVSDGWLTYTRSKTSSVATCPFTAKAPDWFEASPHLAECLLAAPKHAVFLTTKAGRSRSNKSVSSWFSNACTDAGLPHLSLHSVRKGRAAMFRENGATVDQRKGILGHETDSEAHKYSKSADLKKVITGT